MGRSVLQLLLTFLWLAVPGFAVANPAAPAPQDDERTPEPAVDPWAPGGNRSARKALGRLEKEKLALGVVAESASTVEPCARPEGPNLVNFVRRGAAPGEPTYLFGIDLCTRRPFVYQEPTRSGVIVGFDANPPDIHWAEDLSDDRNLRGDRFDVELIVGAEGLFGTSTLEFETSATSSGTVDFAAAPSVGIRVGRFQATVSRAVAPVEPSWVAKFSVTPFRRGPPRTPADVPDPAPASWADRTSWFEAVGDPCNASGVGLRGVDSFRIEHRDDRGRYPVTLEMISYCTEPYRSYKVRTFTDEPYFSQFNNTFPKFAAWDEIPRGGVLNNLAVAVGVGEILNDVFNVDFPTRVIYVGLGYTFGNSRWRIDAGRLFTNEKLEVISAGEPVTVSTEGWTVQVQRALHLEFLGL